jgi:ATP/ADP translocase
MSARRAASAAAEPSNSSSGGSRQYYLTDEQYEDDDNATPSKPHNGSHNKSNGRESMGTSSTCFSKHRDLTCLRSKRFQAVLSMSCSLAIHLGGYELSRAAVMALFTSDGLGFGKSHTTKSGGHTEGGLSALPMAVGCVSPFSVALLWFYGKTLNHGGPRYALRMHTIVCAAAQIIGGSILGSLNQLMEMKENKNAEMVVRGLLFGVNNPSSLSQPILFLLFVFQNAYVQLLYNQHWAFISSVLTADEGTKAFAPIAGLGSIGSTLAAGMVSTLVERSGLIGLLYMAGASFIVSAFFADVAFGVARKNGFEPKGDSDKQTKEEQFPNEPNIPTPDEPNNGKSMSNSITSRCCKKNNIFRQAHNLFQRVPVLGALFGEVIISQCLSSLVNYIYLYKLKATITNDSERAGWSGNFYAWINGVSGVLQFFIIPVMLKAIEAHRIWLLMPSIMLFCTMYQFMNESNSSLFAVSASFFAIKTMEYSLRGAANEMLYVSLDYESRYLGKKVISLVAGKFGKSAMAVGLSVAMMVFGERSDIMWYLLATAVLFSLLWLFSSIRLHSLIETKHI